ncbi:hypothetical protein OG389_28230 [Streptomyces sp. NBC_00435]|uniref:hypothetical protein n=1 Tax=Streptomyces sp. NBC_00435 TaxID=2903649 RepID=UPI002E1A0EBF
MAWRDRLRRRAVVPDAATDRRATAPSGGSAPAAAAREVGVPGDWDGGWRMTTPPQLTVSRAPMGVSDGLAFRSGLAAWRDPSFDTGLAHALLPSAPAGRVRGVVRPATARPTHSGGGPLLLRALRPYGADAAPGTGEPSEQVRTSAPGGPGGPGAPRKRDNPPKRDAPQISRRVRSDAPASGSRASGSRAADSPSPGSPSPSATSSRPSTSGTRGPAAGPEASGPGAPLSAPASAAGTSASVPNLASPRADTGPSAPNLASPPRSGRSSRPATGGAAPGPVVARATARGDAREVPSGKESSGTRGLTPTHSAAVLGAPAPAPAVQRARATGGGTALSPAAPGPAPAPARFPLIRRIAVVPGASAEGAPAARASAGRATTSPSGPSAASTPPAAQRAAARTSGSTSTAGSTGSSSVLEAPGAPTPTPRAEAAHTVVRPRAVGRALTVARVPITPQRRVSVVRTAARTTVPPAHDGGPSPDAPGPDAVQRAGSRAPLGAPLVELPSTAPQSGGPAAAPDSAPAPVLPMVQRQAETAADRPGQAPAPETPARRARTRAPLGVPLTELPPTATQPSRPASTAPDSAPVPAMPTVQRQAEPTADRPASGHPTPRIRSGLGAPLAALPPSATVPTSSASPTSRSRAARPASPAGVHRALAPTDPARPPAPSVHAPLLGAPDAQRRTTESTEPSATAERSASSGPGGPAGAPPLVQRTTATSPDLPTPRSTAPAPAGPGTPARSRRTDRPSPARGTGPLPLVVAGPVSDRSGTPHHERATPAAPFAPRTLQLLAARPLSLGTRDMGSAAAPAPRPASRPVVAARWPASSTAPRQVQRATDGPRGTTPPTPARTSGSVPPGHSPRPAHIVRPAPSPVAAAPLPVTGVHAPPLVVQPSVVAASSAQPVPVVRPRTSAPAVSPAATGTTPPASTPPVQRDTGGGRGTPGPVSVRTAAPPTRGGRPATATGTGTGTGTGTTAAGRHERPRDAVPQQQGGDLDLDDLARRLLDPVARLLRTELRRGRERAGRPFDGRR